MSLTASSDSHSRSWFCLSLCLLFTMAFAVAVRCQTATYHLHQEPSTTSTLFQLKVAGPDTTSLAVQSANLKNAAVGDYIVKAFDTQSGVPNASGVIPAGSIITFTLWMNKTVASGVFYPKAKLQLNSATGTLLCTATGTTALTTTLTKYTLSATTTASLSITTSDRFYVWVGVNVATKATSNTNASLSIEGTLNGNYDSFVVIPNPTPPVPAPAITNLLPNAGSVGTAVTVTGSNFGATQGTSTVTFNGTAAIPTSWNSTSIVTPVPAAAATGPVVVTVGGSPSNSLTFTVAPQINSISTNSGLVGNPVTISGINFGATQGTSAITFNGTTATPTTWNATTIVTNVPAGTTTGPVVVTVATRPSNGVIFSISAPAQPDTMTIYLHKETSTTSGRLQLKPTLPDGTSSALLSAELKGLPTQADYLIKEFDTQVNVPNSPGVIPAFSLVSLKLWMKKTADFGEFYPKVKLTLNGGATICECNSTAPGVSNWITISLYDYLFTCYTQSEITMTSADRLYLWVGVYGYPPTTDRVKAELDIEQGRDSNFVMPVPVPRPAISSLSPNSGPLETAITINGSNFGSAQGTNTVSFNGVFAVPTSWSNTTIQAKVPIGTTSGPVVVTVRKVPSNGVNYSVVSGTIAGNVTRTADGSAVNAAFIEALRSGGYVAGTRSNASGAYTISGLQSGIYDLRVIADDYITEVRTGIAVTAGSTATVNVGIVKPGSIAGRITHTDGTTGIGAATVRAYLGAQLLGKATADSGGYYNLSGVKPAVVMVQANATGFESQTQTGVAVSEQATTTTNLSLNSLTSSDAIKYHYDESGRLVTAEDRTGEVAKYSYDKAGNLLSISRHDPTQVSILEFTPDDGTAGAVVTIYGTGFSAVPGENVVNFNGLPAVVTSAMPTQIVTTAPAGVTTGPITIMTPTGSATSQTPFTLNTSGPTITGFSPNIADSGAALAISGTNFEPLISKNGVSIGVTRAPITASAPTSLAVTVPAKGGSGKVSVTTPAGSAVSSQDFFFPPGSLTAAQVEYTGRMSIGETKTITINTSDKIGLVLFDAVAGSRIGLSVTNALQPISRYMSFATYNPDGSGSPGLGGSLYAGTIFTSTLRTTNLFGGYADALPFTGTYTILIYPSTGSTGNVTLTLSELPAPPTYAISPGGVAKTITVPAPGQHALVTFRAYAGERISLRLINATVGGFLTVYGPDWVDVRGIWISPNNNDPNTRFIDTLTLPTAGTYTFLVRLDGTGTRSVDLILYDVPPDLVNPIIAGGSPVTVTTTVPGQDAVFTFSGSVGQRVSLSVSSTTALGGWELYNPDGSVLPNNGFIDNAGGGGFTESLPLTFNGTYKILFDADTVTGTVTATLYSVPSDFSGTASINGSAVNITTTVPAQNAAVTFSGTSGQVVTVRVTGNTMGSVAVTLQNPDGTTLTSSGTNSSSFNLAQKTLPATGTYKIIVDPSGANTGSANISITSP